MIRNILVYLTHPHVDTWNFKARHRDLLEKRVPGLQVTVCPNSGEFRERLPEAEAVIVWYFEREWLQKAPRLGLIATPAAGGDWIDVEPTEKLKVSFGGFHGSMMAESVLGAIFYFCKAFQFSAEMQKQRKWAPVKVSERLKSLYGARVTVLGFGRIGRAVGRVIKSFGCSITGVKRTPAPPPEYFTEDDRIVAVDKLPEILPETDHLILILPGGAETDGLFTREHFKMLKPTSILYNVGRGNACREGDLVEALRQGEIAGAYLDVFETEPLAEDSLLWDMKNVLIQPHLSAASPQYLDLFVEEFAGRINSGEL